MSFRPEVPVPADVLEVEPVELVDAALPTLEEIEVTSLDLWWTDEVVAVVVLVRPKRLMEEGTEVVVARVPLLLPDPLERLVRLPTSSLPVASGALFHKRRGSSCARNLPFVRRRFGALPRPPRLLLRFAPSALRAFGVSATFLRPWGWRCRPLSLPL
eukprot:4404152-Heterocapsa_arctica.AAC.1